MWFPALPSLEKAFLDSSLLSPVQTVSTHAGLPLNYLPLTYTLLEEDLAELRAMPHLRIMHPIRESPPDISIFDIWERLSEIENAGKIHGYVSSYTHGEEELFAMSFLVRDLHVETRPRSDKLLSLPIGFSISEYDDAGVAMEGVSYRLPQACWRVHSHFQGKTIPSGTLEEMREVEGKTVEEWQGRGVAVGDAAWSIMIEYCDWYENEEEDGVGELDTATQ
jgi:hypothetical protein